MSFSTVFVDLATMDKLEEYLYGTDGNSTTYFVRETRMSTIFSQIPIVLTKSNTPNFGSEWSSPVTRVADYLVNTWLRVKTPEVTLLAGNQYAATGTIRWTKNFMHNLVKEASFTCNDIPIQKLNSSFLDAWSSFTITASKRIGYDNMIGNTAELTQPHGPGIVLPSRYLNLPLPFFYTRDSGVAFPTASIPYVETRINMTFRGWEELLILSNSAATGLQDTVPVVPTDIATAPVLTNVALHCTYAVVSPLEREKMGQCGRDMLIEQVQTINRQVFNPISNPNPSFDIRLSHGIKALFWMVRNTTIKNEWSNYTTATPVSTATAVNYEPQNGAFDPIELTTLIYENSKRMENLGSDYYSLIEPYYKAPAIPAYTGYHMYSYALNITDIDPTGSTNFGKLANVTISFVASPSAIVGANGTGPPGSGMDFPQTYEFICVGVNHNILRVENGTVGFPIM